MKLRRGRLIFQRFVHNFPRNLSDERHRPPGTLLQRVGRVVRRVVDEVHGTFGAMNQLVARRAQRVREAVVPRRVGRCRCGRLVRRRRFGRVRSPLRERRRGLGRAAAHRWSRGRRLRRAAEARGRVVVARVPEVRRGAARR